MSITNNRGLRAKGLVKSYGGRRVVDGVGFFVKPGEVFGLLGPNGAGKTTTFYMIVGLVRQDSGTIELDGKRIEELSMWRRARLGITYLPQEPSIFRGLNVEDNLYALAENLGLARNFQRSLVETLLREFRLEHLRKQASTTLSGGERRRLEIARSLVISPKYILLDEPFAGVDPIAVSELQKIVRELREKEIGVIITDHNVRETLKVCDRALIINEGKVLLEGSSEEIVSDERAKHFYLGEEFRL